MRRFLAASLLILLPAGTAVAQSPAGEWLVKDGTAHIRIVQCSGALWGVLSWAKGPAGKDENNPDPAKRSRSILGVPILINMKPAASQWDGQVYDPQDGSIYNSHIRLLSADVLQIEGCVLGGLICGGENWTRVPLEKGSPPDQAVCSRLSK